MRWSRAHISPFPAPPAEFRRERPRRAFSLVELLVVLGILIILCSIFIPYVGKMRETNRRVGCADNLRQVHTALSKYADANGREFPRTPADPDRPAPYVAFTGAAFVTVDVQLPPATAPATSPATGPSDAPGSPRVGPDVGVGPDIGGGPGIGVAPPATAPASRPATQPAAPPVVRPASHAVQFNDVTASLWLIVRLGYAQPQAFVCPSAGESQDPMLTGGKHMPVGQRSNFTSGRHLSYSYCSPYSAAPRFRLNSDTLPPDFAIVADKSPGLGGKGDNVVGPAFDAPPLQLVVANSNNHDGAGQNVLYVTGEVRFQSSPYCGYGNGWMRDNIYTAYAADPLPPDSNPSPESNGVLSPNVGPAWENDSYLVPTDDE